MRIRPALGSSNPAIMLRSVVLPQPLGPSSVRTSPRRMARLSSRTAVTGPKLLPTPTSSTAVSAAKGGVPAAAPCPIASSSVRIDRQNAAKAEIAVRDEDERRRAEDEERRNGGNRRIRIFADVGVHGDGQGLRPLRRDVERGGEFRQREDGGDKPAARHAGQQQRQGDAAQDPPGRRSEDR